jgi:hypothetical protein
MSFAILIFSSLFFIVHISSTGTMELNSYHLQSPIRVEVIHMTGCFPVPEEIICDIAITTSVPCTLCHDTSHLASVNQSSVCLPKTFDPL